MYESINLNIVIYALNWFVLLSTFLDYRTSNDDRLLSFSIVRVFFALPLLAFNYVMSYYDPDPFLHLYLFQSENIFAVLIIALAYNLLRMTSSDSGRKFLPATLLNALCVASIVIFAGFFHFYPQTSNISTSEIIFSFYGTVYCSSLLLLLSVLSLGWRLEAFWRKLETVEKWRYKYLLVGLALVCALLGWSSSYRLAFLRLPFEHLLLMGISLVIAWGIITYTLARHRLLNRKLFVSRKVIYATITPFLFSGLLILVGVISLLFRIFGWSAPFVIQWLVIIVGIIGITVFALSEDVRRRVKYFISTNFYVNKYEYRDEWTAFSDLLEGKLSEKGVVEALYQILRDSLYTQRILIWLGDITSGFRLISNNGDIASGQDVTIAGDDAIVCYLHSAPYLYSEEVDSDPLRNSILKDNEPFFKANDIVLIVPLNLGNQCAGLIGIGRETTDGKYGHDDFDLLLALSSHAASALLAVQNAEKLATTRERSAYSNVSAFVLHDLKNAATMLDLVKTNAAEHMDNPDFQADMLETIDDALKRMYKVQARLSALKGDKLMPVIQAANIGRLLRSCCMQIEKKLPGLKIEVRCPEGIEIQTDPELFTQILENLCINAKQAGATTVCVEITATDSINIAVSDNGPGIPLDFLPERLFEPFKTGKRKGSGIGLWQVREIVETLGGSVQALNKSDGGAQFKILFNS